MRCSAERRGGGIEIEGQEGEKLVMSGRPLVDHVSSETQKVNLP